MKEINKQVMRVDCSPLNPKQWCLTLECGHEMWVTSKRRPTRRKVVCVECKMQYGNIAPKEEVEG